MSNWQNEAYEFPIDKIVSNFKSFEKKFRYALKRDRANALKQPQRTTSVQSDQNLTNAAKSCRLLRK